MNSIDWVHVVMAVSFCGIHFPLGWAYVHWSLKGLSETDHDAIYAALRPRLRWLFGVWSFALVASVLAYAFASDRADMLRFIAISSIGGFHAIWWPFVVPLFHRMQRELESRGIARNSLRTAAVRTAGLRPRRPADYLRPWMRRLPLAVAVVGLLAVTWRLSLYPPEQMRAWILAVVFASSAVVFLVAWSVWVRREITQSYLVDGDAADAPDRIASAEALRRFRVAMIFWLEIAAALFFFISAVLVIEMDRGAISEQTIGIIGGIGGTTIGAAGAVLGVIASIRANRLQRRAPGERDQIA